MNTGIQDAYNLAWKLALVLKGAASAALLGSYEAERLPVGADVVSRTRTQSERLGREEPKLQQRLIDTQVLVNYRGTDWSKEDIADLTVDLPVRAGDRAPDCAGLSRENVNYPLRLFDVTRGTDYVLVLYLAEAAAPERIELLERMAARLKSLDGPTIRVVVISPPETAILDMVGVMTLRDNERAFFSAYAPAGGSGFLIRPDGYIGYHARPMTEAGLVDYLRTIRA